MGHNMYGCVRQIQTLSSGNGLINGRKIVIKHNSLNTLIRNFHVTKEIELS